MQPFFNSVSQKPGFLVADVVYGRAATPDDVGFFLEKLTIVCSFKNISTFLPVLLVESVTKETLKLLKDNKVVVALIDNVFDKNYTRLLGELVSVFANAGAIIVKNPSQIEKLFSKLSKAEERYNDLIGDMFELITAYYFQQLGCRYLDIRKKIQIPDSHATNEINVLVEKDGCINVIECKATRSCRINIIVRTSKGKKGNLVQLNGNIGNLFCCNQILISGRVLLIKCNNNFNTVILNEDEFSHIALITDRDDRNIDEIANEISNGLSPFFKNIKNGEWHNNEYVDMFGIQKNIKSLFLVIPKEQQGALETVMLSAISEDPYDRNIVNKCTDFVSDLQL